MAISFEAQPIAIGGRPLPAERIQAEMQYHPAESADEAWRLAAHALVVKALLHRRALELGLVREADPFDPAMPTDWIDPLLEAEIDLPAADEETYRRFHAAHPELFQDPMAADAQHILLAAPADDEPARRQAKALAAELIREIAADPARFEPLAGKHSSCPTAPLGGHLGRVERGSTVEEFETYLFSLQDGELCPLPILSRYGVHVLRVIKRHPAKPASFEAARERVIQVCDDHRWLRKVRDYLRQLAANTDIVGIALE